MSARLIRYTLSKYSHSIDNQYICDGASHPILCWRPLNPVLDLRSSLHSPNMQRAALRRSAVVLNNLRHAQAARQCTRRTLATATESDSLDVDFPPPLPEFDSSPDTSASAHTQSVFVRPWDGISSMPELLAMIRGLERHYGTIREYGVMRVSGFCSLYIPLSWETDIASLLPRIMT